MQSYAAEIKDTESTRVALETFLGPQIAPDHIYSDNAPEIIKAVTDKGWKGRHDTSTPNRPATNGIAEHAVRQCKEGASAVLLQGGFQPAWWADGMSYYTFVHNVSDKLSDGMTPYEKRFGIKFDGPLYPLGCEVQYKPSSPVVQSQMHPMGSKTLAGVFLGYKQKVGGDWSGDLLVADWEDFEKADHVGNIPVRSIKAAEITPTWYSNDFRFPLATGVLRQPVNASLPKERNRQSRAVVWEDTSADEQIPDDGELEEEQLVDEEELEPSDKLEESGGRKEYFESNEMPGGSPRPSQEDPELKK